MHINVWEALLYIIKWHYIYAFPEKNFWRNYIDSSPFSKGLTYFRYTPKQHGETMQLSHLSGWCGLNSCLVQHSVTLSRAVVCMFTFHRPNRSLVLSFTSKCQFSHYHILVTSGHFANVLVCLGCYNETTMNRMASKQQKFKIRVPTWWKPSSGIWMVKGVREFSQTSFRRELIPFMT